MCYTHSHNQFLFNWLIFPQLLQARLVPKNEHWELLLKYSDGLKCKMEQFWTACKIHNVHTLHTGTSIQL